MFRSDLLRNQLVRRGMWSISVRTGQIALAFVTSVVLARVLGAAGFGIFAFVYALVMLLVVPVQLGLPQLVVRETAAAHATSNWDAMRGLWRWSNRVLLGLSAIASLILASSILVALAYEVDRERIMTYIFGFTALPFIAFGNLRSAMLRGLRKVIAGQLPESLLRPAIFLLLVAWVSFAYGVAGLGPAWTMGLYVIASMVAFLIGAAMLRSMRPPEMTADASGSRRHPGWWRSLVPLALIVGLHRIIANMDILMVGLLGSDTDVGIYRVVVQVSLTTVLALEAVQMLVAPYISGMKAQDDIVGLARLAKRSAQGLLVLTTPIVLVILLFGDWLLARIFGAAFVAGYWALAILCLGRLLNAGIGLVGTVLQMTGFERETLAGTGIAASLNLVLNLILIPLYGINGAAVATAVSLVVSHLIMHHFVLRRIGVEISAWPSAPVRRRD